MSITYMKQAKRFVLEMVSHDGACGVDLDSAAYQDMLDEILENDAEVAALGKEKFEAQIHMILSTIGSEGFAILSDDTEDSTIGSFFNGKS